MNTGHFCYSVIFITFRVNVVGPRTKFKLARYSYSSLTTSLQQSLSVPNVRLSDEEETRNTIYVATVSETHEYIILARGPVEPNNGAFLTK